MASQQATDRQPFPRTDEEFENDPRVSYSTIDAKWILEDYDGSEWEWIERVGKWVPSLDESLLEQQQAAYGGPVYDGDDEPSASSNSNNLKRKIGGQETDETAKSKRQKSGPNNPQQQRKNTAVYVTNLPPDATVDEINKLFSRCGVIAEEIDSKAPRIKLYTDSQGNVKGDALVVYFRPESVKLAVQLLDDTDFRFGITRPEGSIHVKEADFSYKKVKDAGAADGEVEKKAEASSGARDRKKVIKKTQKMNNKLTDWSSPEPSPPPSKLARLVYLKPMFTEEETKDPEAMWDIEQDIREESARLGEVTRVILYDAEPEGVASVRFKDPVAAMRCVQLMSGRMFDGKKVEAWIAEGDEKFKKAPKKDFGFNSDQEQEEEEAT